MKRSEISRVTLGAAAVLASLLEVPSAAAQSCVLCYTSVAGGGPAVVRAFTFGVLTLLIPALLLCIAIVLFIWRRVRVASRPSPAVAVPAEVPLARLRRVPKSILARLGLVAPHA